MSSARRTRPVSDAAGLRGAGRIGIRPIQGNVFVTRQNHDGAPVVRKQPDLNLVGKIEYKSRFGFVTTDHNMIKAGAIHRANGGHLVVQAFDAYSPFSWDA